MAEKKPRKKKSLKVELENKTEQPQMESMQVEENTIDVPELEPKGKYTFVSNGTFKTMPKGSVWSITGEAAMIFIKQGYGSLKK
jgi:hypothetical protein